MAVVCLCIRRHRNLGQHGDSFGFVNSKRSAYATTYCPVLFIMIPLTLGLVHYHPEPIEDCPCFEDAIAMLSVILGIFIGHWYAANHYAGVYPADLRDLWTFGPWFGIFWALSRIIGGE
jgi:hypothetical protein